MTLTIFCWASSTSRILTGPMYSISSRSISAARVDMFLKTLAATSFGVALRASERSFVSTSRNTICRERSSSMTMSSKTNMRRLISSVSSGLSTSSVSMMVFSVVRSTRLRTSTMALTPPAVVKSWVTREESFRSNTRSTSRSTSGEVRSIMAMRRATSACLSCEREAKIVAA